MGRNGRPQVIERVLKQLGDRLAGGKDGLENRNHHQEKDQRTP